MRFSPSCGCCGAPTSPCEWCTALPDAFAVAISGLGETDDCCDLLNDTFVLTPSGFLCDADNPCVFEYPNTFLPAFCTDYYITICAVIAEDDDDPTNYIKITVTFTVYRGSPFFDTPLLMIFEDVQAKPFDCTSWSSTALTKVSYAGSVELNCDEGTLAMTLTAL